MSNENAPASDPRVLLDQALTKYGKLEVAITLTVQELTDVASLALIGAGFCKPEAFTEGVREFLESSEGILKQLSAAIENGDEIVAL